MGINRDASDVAFSDAVRLKKNYICEDCGLVGGKGHGTPQMDCAHIFSRRHKATRWDTLNALCLCRACHQRHGESPVEFTRWLEGYVGRGYLDILNEKKNTILKTTKAYRKEVAAHYRKEIKLMESGPHDLVSFQ